MNAHVSPAGLYVALEISFLGGVEYIAGGIQEYDGGVAAQVPFREGRRIFGRIHHYAVFPADLAQGGDANGDTRVAVTGGFGKYENARRSVVWGATGK